MIIDAPAPAPQCEVCEAERADMAVAGYAVCETCLRGIFDSEMSGRGSTSAPH